MRVYVNDNDGTNINIRIPTGLLLNRVTALVLSKVIEHLPGTESITLSKAQIYFLIKTLKKFKKSHPGWKLVEVHSAEGDVVEITL